MGGRREGEARWGEGVCRERLTREAEKLGILAEGHPALSVLSVSEASPYHVRSRVTLGKIQAHGRSLSVVVQLGSVLRRGSRE